MLGGGLWNDVRRGQGTIPNGISALTALTYLGVAANPGITGTLCPCLSTLTGLQDLVVEGCSLSGTLPATLTALRRLQ
jgi:hypothetical protein